MKAIMKVISKNFKVLLRSKSSALIVIFGPLIVTLLVGLAFNNTSLFNLKVGAYSPNMDDVTDSFLDKLREQDFSVTTYDNKDRCVESIKQGIIHACMVFSDTIDFTRPEGNEITFYVDNSRVNIVYTIMDTVSAGISSRTQEISAGLVQVLVDQLDSTKATLDDEGPTILKLIEQNEDVRGKQGDIDSKLAAMDLSIDTSAFKTSTMKSTYASRISELETMSSSVLSSTGDAGELVNDSSLNATDKDNINEELADISESVSDLDLNGSKWTTLSDMFEDLDEEVGDVSTKLSAASSSKTQITGITGAVEATLDANLNNVMSLKSSVEGIQSEIEGIQMTDVGGIVNPIQTKVEHVAAQTFLSFLYPSLVTLLIMFTSVLLGSTLIMGEKHSRAFFRNLISPMKNTLFIYSTYGTVLIVLLIQLVIIFAITQWGLKIPVMNNLFSTLILTFLLTTVFTLLGIVIGQIFNSEETSAMAAISLSSGLLFLSNMILPLESMPLYIQEIARFNPFVIGEKLLREAILFQVPLSSQLSEAYVSELIPAPLLLTLYAIILFMGLLLVLNVAQRFFLIRYVLGLKRQEGPPAEPTVPEGSIAEMLAEGTKMIQEGNIEEAKATYVSINEQYSRLPKQDKRQHYQQIVEYHKRLDAALEQGDAEETSEAPDEKDI